MELGRGSELVGFEDRQASNAWIGPALAVASRDFSRAADLLAEMGGESEEAFARLRDAQALVNAGRRDEAGKQLDRALTFYRSVGARHYVREGEALLAASV